jgi:hypothetical protein
LKRVRFAFFRIEEKQIRFAFASHFFSKKISLSLRFRIQLFAKIWIPVQAAMKTMQKRINYDEIPKSILGHDDPLFKNGPGYVAGSADGRYDEFHKKTRVQWHDTMKVANSVI